MGGEITITDRAAEKIRVLLAGSKGGHGLRVKVVEGGCSGFAAAASLGKENNRHPYQSCTATRATISE